MEYPFRSEKPQVVYRAAEEAARHFARTVEPALRLLTGYGVVICREAKAEDLHLDVRAMTDPAVARAVYLLICDRAIGREDVTAVMIDRLLEEGNSAAASDDSLGSLADRRGTRGPGDRSE